MKSAQVCFYLNSPYYLRSMLWSQLRRTLIASAAAGDPRIIRLSSLKCSQSSPIFLLKSPPTRQRSLIISVSPAASDRRSWQGQKIYSCTEELILLSERAKNTRTHTVILTADQQTKWKNPSATQLSGTTYCGGKFQKKSENSLTCQAESKIE